AALKAALHRGVGGIQSSRDMEKVRSSLVRTLAQARAIREATPAARHARALALLRFEATLGGVECRRLLAQRWSTHAVCTSRIRPRARCRRPAKTGVGALLLVSSALG